MATSARRAMLRTAGIAGAALPFGCVAPRGFATSRLAASFDPVILPYPRHRGDPRLVELRCEVLGLLGLDATW
jgi:hypothetical protein